MDFIHILIKKILVIRPHAYILKSDTPKEKAIYWRTKDSSFRKLSCI